MKQDVLLATNVADTPNVLNDTGLVVDVHDRYELRVVTNRRLQFFHRQEPIGVRLEPAYFVAVLFQMFEGIRYRLVFRRHRDQVFTAMRAIPRRSDDCQVVGFGGAGGPDETFRVGIQQGGQLLPRSFHVCKGFPSCDVDRCRICEHA